MVCRTDMQPGEYGEAYVIKSLHDVTIRDRQIDEYQVGLTPGYGTRDISYINIIERKRAVDNIFGDHVYETTVVPCVKSTVNTVGYPLVEDVNKSAFEWLKNTGYEIVTEPPDDLIPELTRHAL